MTRPLNPRLYRLLMDRFRQVRISNQGVAQTARYRFDRIRNRNALDMIEPGEYYQVCCPHCNDTRFRLYINHRWGVEDDQGYRNLWMAICYNENCFADGDRRRALYEELTSTMGVTLDHARILPGEEVDVSKVVMEWPGPVTRVDKLPEDHKAVQYLLSRNFDPEKIGRFYNVHYCHDSVRWLAKDRLIIPIYQKKVMWGWQARYIGELPWYDKKKRKMLPPKYWTVPGTPRRHLIYNMANAAQYCTGVIVEGPTDVWSFGPMACCTFGDTMTSFQRRRFHSQFQNHAAILLFDPDAWNSPKMQKIVEAFEGRFSGGFAAVKLPEGRDPGNLDRGFLREYVAQEARSAGVTVSWMRR